MSQPVNVPVVLDKPLLSYYQARLSQSNGDWYKGHELVKMPEDLRVYQHLIESTKPEVIIELGGFRGGSAVWFADQLDTFCGGGRVVSVDLRLQDFMDPRIRFLTGDIDDRTIADAVRAVASGKRVLISEDSAHTYESTHAALTRYSDLVGPGQWFIIEDTVVDDPNLNVWGNGKGVVQAIDDFLKSKQGGRFHRREMNFYGITSNPGGYLQAHG